MLKQDLDTPSLLIDLDLVERNIAEMAAFFRGHGVGWRPHTKGQKVPRSRTWSSRRVRSASPARSSARPR